VAVWNLETEWVDAFLHDHPGAKFTGTKTLQELVAALDRPRRIMMLIPAGAPVDQMLDKLTPLLDQGDILIDGGNSYFQDTRRREAAVRAKGLHFVGCGVSGGEDGARRGPSLMPGRSDRPWTHIRDVLEAIAATTEAGPCVTHVGTDGAGHFIKMVHNGIEWRRTAHRRSMTCCTRPGSLDARSRQVFAGWNRGVLESFLVELTAQVCRVIDPQTQQPMVDVIQDKAGQKGTGKWTAQVALELAVAIPTIGAALDARVLSSLKDQRVAAGRVFAATDTRAPFGSADRARWQDDLRDALYAARICSYAQGMALIAAGAAEYKWTIDLSRDGRASGRAAASSGRGCSIRCARRSPAAGRWRTCWWIRRSPPTCSAPRPDGAASLRRPPRRASPCPRSARAWRTSTATARRGSRRTSRRRSATPSAPTRSSASRNRASCTSTGDSQGSDGRTAGGTGEQEYSLVLFADDLLLTS
jgi:6-phosphogluconate dehydrogenase